MRKKIFFILSIGIFGLVLLLFVVNTAEAGGITVRLENPLVAETFGELIENLIIFIFNISLAIAPLMIIIAGILFVTAAGSPEQIGTAKKLILYTLIGFLIILLSRGLIVFFKEVFEIREKREGTYLNLVFCLNFVFLWLKEKISKGRATKFKIN